MVPGFSSINSRSSCTRRPISPWGEGATLVSLVSPRDSRQKSVKEDEEQKERVVEVEKREEEDEARRRASPNRSAVFLID